MCLFDVLIREREESLHMYMEQEEFHTCTRLHLLMKKLHTENIQSGSEAPPTTQASTHHSSHRAVLCTACPCWRWTSAVAGPRPCSPPWLPAAPPPPVPSAPRPPPRTLRGSTACERLGNRRRTESRRNGGVTKCYVACMYMYIQKVVFIITVHRDIQL